MTNQGTRLAGSIIHAANETAPLIVDGIQEFTDQIPLITGFASAYAEVNAEQTQKVIDLENAYCQAQVQVQVGLRSGEGQEGQEGQIWT